MPRKVQKVQKVQKGPQRRWSKKRAIKALATLDVETWRFVHGRAPQPIAAAYWHPEDGYIEEWGEGCLARLLEALRGISEPRLIYAHNGGRFDFLLPDAIAQVLQAKRAFHVKTRLVSWTLDQHELRDSFAILPAALGKIADKRRIAMSKLEPGKWQKHRAEIAAYLEADCKELYPLVKGFLDAFGAKLTCASAALSELIKRHPFERLTPDQDAELRPFYLGARVESFVPPGSYRAAGDQQWRVYDVNSMYPAVMRDRLHPRGSRYSIGRSVSEDTCFIELEAASAGAWPIREEDGSTSFPADGWRRIFKITIHEFNMAERLGLVRGARIIRTLDFAWRDSFEAFVNEFYGKRREAKAASDRVRETLFKTLLNASYGKTGIDPETYEETILRPRHWGDWLEGWGDAVALSEQVAVFSRPVSLEDRFARDPRHGGLQNVAIAASITGAARAVLLEARHRATNPIYCDTDSLICEGLPADMIDPGRLGAWKLEEEGAEAVIIAKKTYALADSRGRIVKRAHKGLADMDLRAWGRRRRCGLYKLLCDIAAGRSTPRIPRQAPSYGLAGELSFISRTLAPTPPKPASLPAAVDELAGEFKEAAE
jgi:hypothetical protein